MKIRGITCGNTRKVVEAALEDPRWTYDGVSRAGHGMLRWLPTGEVLFFGLTPSDRNSWKNTVAVVVLANTPDVCANIIDGLANGKFVIILRNLSKGADGKAEYQVFGYAQALKASAGENDKYSDDTEGGWLITLEEESVPKAAYFFFDTDSETTAAKYQSLLTEAAA